MRRRIHVNVLLRAIIAEAEVAMRRANFQPQIEHIHRLVFVIERRMMRFEDEQAWWRLRRRFRQPRSRRGRQAPPTR